MSIFEEDSDIVTIDEQKDYMSELVGEGKKFKDVQSLARGKAEADAYIKQLTERLDEARNELKSRTNLEDFLKEMKNLKEVKTESHVETPRPGGEADSESLEEKIAKILESQNQKKTSESNLDRVQRVLKEQLGDNAKQVINRKSQDLGMSVSELENLAARSPSAFFTLVGVSETVQQVAPVTPRSSVNTFGNNASAGVKNKAYFDRLKQTDPKAYMSPKTTVEMIKARNECAAKNIPWE